MSNLIQAGVTLSDGTVIGAMSDVETFGQFAFDGATYANAINAAGNSVTVPKRGNLYRIHKMSKTERAKLIAKDRRAAMDANIARYTKIKEEGGQGADLGLYMFQGEDEIVAEEARLGLTTTQSIERRNE
jgi:hypothetical protein